MEEDLEKRVAKLEERIKKFDSYPDITPDEIRCRKACKHLGITSAIFKFVTPDYYQQNLFQRRFSKKISVIFCLVLNFQLLQFVIFVNRFS
jgi:hypothetical protein